MSSQPGYQRGDRIALVATDDPDTRLRPGDQGTVTRWDPAQGQFSDCSVLFGTSELRFYVADMPVTLSSVHGASAAVRKFEEVYQPELAAGPVVFTDYLQIASNQSR